MYNYKHATESLYLLLIEKQIYIHMLFMFLFNFQQIRCYRNVYSPTILTGLSREEDSSPCIFHF
jgi:hypothetical protein